MKIMIADGSAVVRAIIEQNLKQYADIQIIASVSNCKKIVDCARNELPDAVISGTDLTDESENAALKKLSLEMQLPLIVMADSQALASASHFPSRLQTPAEVIPKPGVKEFKDEFFSNLVDKLKAIETRSDMASRRQEAGKKEYKLLCIGASTGGPTAVSEVLAGLGKDFPLPILYTQHIEIGADKNMADWFSTVCPNLKIKLAANGEEARPGTVYMAPADRHLIVDCDGPHGLPIIKLSDEEPERFLRPAVNKLFRSAATIYQTNTLAVLLTGMGADGAEGCKVICDRGGWTIVEDKSTCAVFGMPAAAIELGGAREVLPRGAIPKRILELVRK
jgi:two-component system chemotaxis response regulator CheB